MFQKSDGSWEIQEVDRNQRYQQGSGIMEENKTGLMAGAAQVEITPEDSQFLGGYPHVERYSTGVHDALWASAIYLSDGETELILIGNDILFVPNELCNGVRQRIEAGTGIPASNILISATHTHSGPMTVNNLSNLRDETVPPADPSYLQLMEDRMVEAALKAVGSKQPARLGLAVADATGIGTNRRDPKGPSDMEMPVLLIQSADGSRNLAAMLVCCMHPTVMHEDSTLVSGDFPGMARIFLQEQILGKECVVLHHTGPAGNQSPRHVTQANTFEEAVRLGELLGRAVERVIPNIEFSDQIALGVTRGFVEMPVRNFPEIDDAERMQQAAKKKLARLREDGAPQTEIRTAEVDWFGTEKALTLARAAADGLLDEVARSVMPTEIQIFSIGKWRFVAWPGEVFIEYGLKVKERLPNTFVISLANGTLQGYISTPEAIAAGGYEAFSGIFSPESGQMLVDKTLEIMPPVDPCPVKLGAHRAVTPIARTDQPWWMPHHQSVLKRVAQGHVDLVMIGDSIIFGFNNSGKAMWEKYYAPRNALNLGFSGDRTEYVLWRLEHGELDGISPKLAVVLIGTNNSNGDEYTTEQIADGIKAIVCTIRTRLPETKVLILAIFPRGDAAQRDAEKQTASFNAQWAKNQQASELASKIADGKMIHYLDINDVFLNGKGELTREIMPDLLHLHEKGYQLWAEAMEPTIAKLMGE